MVNFPLYDNLVSKLPSDIVIEDTDKQQLIQNINEYNDTHELVFAVIRCYQINNSNNINNEPFYSRYLKTKNGYKFDINNIPDKLIKMLMDFYIIHEKSEKSEKNDNLN